MKTIYVTDDGSRFDTKAEAEAHETSISTKERDLDDAKEFLNKALVILKSDSLINHSKADDVRYTIEKFIKFATTNDDYYTSNC